MPIRISDFPNCCSASVMHAFGGSRTAMYGREDRPDETKLAAEVAEKMKAQQTMGFGIITAMLTTEQTVAAKVLEGLGWKMVTESHKNKHSETKLQLWAFACKADEKENVVVANPFQPKTSIMADVKEAVMGVVGPRMLHQYLRPPVGRWIPADGALACPESIRDRMVATLIVSNQNREARIQQGSRRGDDWAWGMGVGAGARITHVYIHPL